MNQCCEKSDACGEWHCSTFKPLLYIILFFLYTALFVTVIYFFVKFLQSSTGDANSKRSLICYFLLATMLLARMLFFADVWIDFNDVVFDSLAQISNVFLVLTALFLQYQELRILTRMKYSTPVNQRLALIILACMLFFANMIYLIVAAILIVYRENAICHATTFSDVKSNDNGVWIINAIYNLTNSFIFMVILLTIIVGVRVRRISLQGEEKRRVYCFNLTIFILLAIKGIVMLTIFREEEEMYYQGSPVLVLADYMLLEAPIILTLERGAFLLGQKKMEEEYLSNREIYNVIQDKEFKKKCKYCFYP